MQRYTATQMAEILTQKFNKKITTEKVQKALVELEYTKKIGRKYVPTEKGEMYSQKLLKQKYSYYVWSKDIFEEVEAYLS